MRVFMRVEVRQPDSRRLYLLYLCRSFGFDLFRFQSSTHCLPGKTGKRITKRATSVNKAAHPIRS